jgi:hypothetical protein
MDFAITWLLTYWRVLAIRAMVGATVDISGPGRSKIRQNLPSVAYLAKPIGIGCCDGRDMLTVAPAMRELPVGEVEAEP